MKYFRLFICLCFFVAGVVQAQNYKPAHYVGLSSYFGHLIPNSANYSYMHDFNSFGLDVKYAVQSYGDKEWQQYHHYPRYGGFFRYVNTHFDTVGEKYEMLAFMNAPIFRYQKFSFNYQIAAGVTYFPTIYDEKTNPGNIWIGSHLNVAIDLALDLTFELSGNFDLRYAWHFSHSSNGATKRPNLGINSYYQELGLCYFLQNRNAFEFNERKPTPFQPENEFILSFAPGYSNYNIGGATYFAATTSLLYQRHYMRFLKYGGSFDLGYNGAMGESASSFDTKDLFTYAAAPSFEILYGRFSIYLSLGFYLTKPLEFHTWYYERAGFKYYFSEKQNFFAGAFVKAHAGSVDYLEWTLGMRLFRF